MEYETTIMVFEYSPGERCHSPSLNMLFTEEPGVITVLCSCNEAHNSILLLRELEFQDED
jgi:hypothetical protein